MKIFGLLPFLMNSAVAAPTGGAGAIASGPGDGGNAPDSGGGDLVPAGGSDGQVHDAEFVDDQGGGQQVQTRERMVENGRITQNGGRPVIEAIRAANPRMVQPVTQALLFYDRFKREVPGGFKEIQALRDRIEKGGGETGLTQTEEMANHLLALDAKYLKSDPSFIEDITTGDTPEETEEYQEAFKGLMPAVMAKWAQIDPAGRAYWTAQQLARGMDTMRIPVLTARIVDILKANAEKLPPGLIDSYDELTNALNAISYAVQAPQRQQVDPKRQERGRQADQLMGERRESWTSLLGSRRKELFNAALAKYVGNRRLTTEERAQVKGAYDIRVFPKARAREKNIDRFLQVNDRDGYLKSEGSFWAKEIDEAIRQAVSKLPAPGQKGRAQAARPVQRQQTTPAAQGWTRVARQPADLDPRRTTKEMLRENKGITRDGKQVQWPAARL